MSDSAKKPAKRPRRPIGDFLKERGVPEDTSRYEGKPVTTLRFAPLRKKKP